MSSCDSPNNPPKPSLLWISRSILFTGKLNQNVELPDNAGRLVRWAVYLHESKKKSKWIEEISYTLGFAAFVVLISVDGILYKTAAAFVLLLDMAIVVIPALVWAWYGGWRFMKENGWGWKPEYVIHRRRHRAIKR